VRRAALPLLAGLVAAAAAFAIASSALDGDSAPAPTTATTRAASAAPAGRTVFAAQGCGSCHRLAAAGSRGEVGPPLDQRLPGHTAASLRRAITDPPPGSAMPEDFERRMTPAELDALVRFLLASR
jgi:mono/diheme cytochrome c family protein